MPRQKKVTPIVAGTDAVTVHVTRPKLCLIAAPAGDAPRPAIIIERTVDDHVRVLVRSGGKRFVEMERKLTYEEFAAGLRKAFK